MKVAVLLLPMIASALWLAPAVHAQEAPRTFHVNTLADLVDDNIADGLCHTAANTCSLRAAVMQANHPTVAATVIAVPAGIYALTRAAGPGGDETGGDLNLLAPLVSGQSVTIDGAGAESTIIDAQHLGRALEVQTGRNASLAHVTIRNGNSDDGGGIRVDGGTLTLRDCIVEDNRATSDGGGIYIGGGGLNIVRSTIRRNIAAGDGGGLYSGASSAIRESTISDNGAQQAGGIGNYGQLHVVNSTISRNYANGDAGGVYNGLAAYFYNASIINNDADHDRDELGGIGGGLYVEPGSPTFVVNTLVLDNTTEDAPIYNDCYGTLTGYGANLFTDISGCTVDGARTIVPLGTMGALQDNGGPTLTHAPHADSLAIDNTNDALGCVDETGAPLSIDQRGAARIAGLRCDIGALEVGAAVERIFRYGFE